MILRADFSYREAVQAPGGESVSVTRLLKGNRMAELSKGRIAVIDLDHEILTEIDLAKKTYSVASFEQLKKTFRSAGDFKVSTQSTGQTKKSGVLNLKETVITATSGDTQVVVDAWMGTIPGYGGVAQFDRTLGQKLGFVFASAAWRLAKDHPEALQGLEVSARELNKLTGVPLEYTIRMGKVGELGPAPQTPGKVAETLGRIGLGDANGPADTAARSSSSLLEVRTELDNFSAGPADGSKFDVPAGFKKIDSPFAK